MKHLPKIATLQAALEELDDGKTRIEKEHVFYGRITDFDVLKNATKVIPQEQWDVKVPKTSYNLASGQIRVRKFQEGKDGTPEYVFVIKSKLDAGGRLENTLPASAEAFEIFRNLSDQGMIKHRYEFPNPNGGKPWEVDVFLKPDGSYYNYCKIDLEVDDMNAPLPALPIPLDEVIKEEGPKLPAEQRAIVTKWFDQYFLTRPAQLMAGKPEGEISMEGLMDDLKGALKSVFHNPRAKEREEAALDPTKDIAKTIKLIRETFADDDWVAQHKLSEEPISAEFIGKALAVRDKLADDVKPDVKRTVDEIVSFAKRCSSNYVAFGDHVQRIFEPLHKPGDNPGEQWVKASQAIDQLPRAGDFAMKNEPDTRSLVGGVVIKRSPEPKRFYKEMPRVQLGQYSVKDETVRPLKSLEIIGMAETIIYLLENLFPVVNGRRNFILWNVTSPLFHLTDKGSKEFPEDLLDTYEDDFKGDFFGSSAFAVYYTITDQHHDPMFEYAHGFNDLANNAVKAMLVWINKSLK